MHIVRLGAASREGATAEDIGAKAAILAAVAAAGVPVPPAFILPIGLGAAMAAGDRGAETAFLDGLKEGISYLETATGRGLGVAVSLYWFRSARERRGRCRACSTPCSMSAARRAPCEA